MYILYYMYNVFWSGPDIPILVVFFDPKPFANQAASFFSAFTVDNPTAV